MWKGTGLPDENPVSLRPGMIWSASVRLLIYPLALGAGKLRVLSNLVMACLALPPTTLAQLRGVPTENIDRTVNPCTDFDAYANGQWRA
ncbi:MAG: hypothetical protein QOE55_5008, partial [Acidobacteriaceae bacterium]|nr:hypothetical protein [Acidobacteriaceae bacterium]